jgi:hypothetical protein
MRMLQAAVRASLPCALLEHVCLLHAGWLDLEHNICLEAGSLVNNGGTSSLVVVILQESRKDNQSESLHTNSADRSHQI